MDLRLWTAIWDHSWADVVEGNHHLLIFWVLEVEVHDFCAVALLRELFLLPIIVVHSNLESGESSSEVCVSHVENAVVGFGEIDL